MAFDGSDRRSMSLLDETYNEDGVEVTQVIDDTIVNLLNERPNLGAWSKADVQDWIIKSKEQCLMEV